MEKNFRHIILLLTGLAAVCFLNAQQLNLQNNPLFGPDSASRMKCAANLSTMGQYVKINMYDYAYQPWIECFKNCPAASKNIYLYGEKIINYKIDKSETEEIKQAYIDTLMLLYDQRMKNFDQEGKVLGKKGVDLINYRRDAVEEAYGYLKRSLEIEQSEVDEAVAATLISCSSILYRSGKIQADEMILNYLTTTDAINSHEQTEKSALVLESIERTFFESGADSCDALTRLLLQKYENNKNDIATLKRITEILEKANCQKTDLFANASENLFELEPSANSAAKMGMVFAAREEYSKAKKYYFKALELETDTMLKAKYNYQLAAISFQTKNMSEVKKYGYEAIELNPEYGDAYLLIGNAYAASSQSCGNSNFEKAAVFLVAVDKFLKAREVDESVAEKANGLINNYSRFFPNNEDAFFEGYVDGQSYTVKCWINEPTTIRTIKK